MMGYFSLRHPVHTGSEAHPASYAMVNWSFPPGLKHPGREFDYSPQSTAEVNKAWSYTSTPQYVFTAWRLIKQ
jgi:hypothetical protein